MKRIHLIISGSVQGVFFRHHTDKIANEIGVKGFVRNLDNGNVEVIAEGTEDQIERLIEFCRKGPSGAYVTDIEIKYENPKNEFTTFSIE